MGTSVTARCACGLHDEDLAIGGGMHNFEKFCSFPVLCRHCRALRSANLLAHRIRCNKCGSTAVTPYDDPALRQGDGQQTVADWNINARTLMLTDAAYYGPACRQFTLRFSPGQIQWD